MVDYASVYSNFVMYNPKEWYKLLYLIKYIYFTDILVLYIHEIKSNVLNNIHVMIHSHYFERNGNKQMLVYIYLYHS
jgi:hypothetical protein